MKLGKEIHFKSTDEAISALSLAYSQVKDINSNRETEEAIGGIWTGLTENERQLIGPELTRRMRRWDLENQEDRIHKGINPYSGLATYLDPQVSGS